MMKETQLPGGSNKKFFSLAATYRGDIVGMIVAEIKNRTKIHKEVSVCSDGSGADTSGRCLRWAPSSQEPGQV